MLKQHTSRIISYNENRVMDKAVSLVLLEEKSELLTKSYQVKKCVFPVTISDRQLEIQSELLVTDNLWKTGQPAGR